MVQKVQDLISKFGKAQPQEIQAFVFNAPDTLYDSIKGIFSPDGNIERKAIFRLKDKPIVLLVYSTTDLRDHVKASGIVKINELSYDLQDHWYFMDNSVTLTTINPKPFASLSAKEFVNKIADGEIWLNPTEMTPYQFGNSLALKEVERQANKHKWSELGDQLSSAVKWLVAGLLLSLVLLLVMTLG